MCLVPHQAGEPFSLFALDLGDVVEPVFDAVESLLEAILDAGDQFRQRDLVGDDETSAQLLAQPDLAAHAAWVMDAMPVLDESGRSMAARAASAGHSRVTVAFRSDGEPDIVLRIDGADSNFSVMPLVDAVDVDVVASLRPDHRLLVLWGRRPARLDIDVTGDADLWSALNEVFWPHALAWG